MLNFFNLFKARLVTLLNYIKEITKQSKLKIVVILFASIAFWAGLYLLFFKGYNFISRFPEVGIDFLTEYLFGLLFLALTIMLIISNAIISFSSLYKSKETAFLLSKPVSSSSIFGYKLIESIGFSSWAFMFLVTPLLFAYGVHRDLPLLFYPISVIFIFIYLLIPAGLGALLALLIARFTPQRKKEVAIATILGIIAVALILISEFVELRSLALPFSARWMEELLGRFSFTQNPILPSYWLVQGIMAIAKSDLARMGFFLLFILAQSLCLLVLILNFAKRFYFTSYSRMQSSRRTRKYAVKDWVEYLGNALTFYLPGSLRQIILKDMKTLLRDPVQWSQSLVFFGLLAVYFVNLRNLPYLRVHEPFWQYLISFLNLLATSLTLATFTTRFIYPQLSLEGQRFWVIGLAPIKRRTIVYGKFIFALIGSLIISETLIFISNSMLKTPISHTLMQCYTVFIICMGLSGLAVGFGALYPNLKEDNPSKMVSGFGGTLTLVLSMMFVVTVIAIEAVPSHLHHALGWMRAGQFQLWSFVSIGIITLLGGIVTFLPLHYGLKAIEKLEV